MKTKDIKKALKPRKPERASNSPKDYVSTGSTILNLNLSGFYSGGIKKGTVVILAGDSDSGKTFLAKTILAQASINEAFDNYRLIDDNPEYGSMMDITTFFGRKLEERLEEHHSQSVEEFYHYIDDLLEDGKPFILVLDSMDSLPSLEDVEQFAANKEATRKGTKKKESYGQGKPKANSQNLRLIAQRIAESGSILIIIAQLRTNLGFGSQFNPKVMSGGTALKYYAHMLLWTSTKETMKVKVKGKDVEQGIKMLVKVKKNRQRGRKRSALVPIYHSHGIDDTGSCLDYLVELKHWKKKAGKIAAKEFGKTLDEDGLIQYVEAQPKRMKLLRKTVATVFKDVEKAASVQRRNPYAD